METQMQLAIRLLWLEASWRSLYCDDIELQASHGRVTRNTISKEGLDNFKAKMVSEMSSRLFSAEKIARESGFRFDESPEIRNKMELLSRESSWKPLSKSLGEFVNWLKAVYNNYAPQGADAPRVVNRFTDKNRLGWTKQQWDHYLNEATPTFRRMIASIKKQAPVDEIRKDAKSLYSMFQSGKGVLSYPGLDRLFRDLLDTLDQLPFPTINKQQSIILANVYDKKILPRLHMLWMFARQERPNV